MSVPTLKEAVDFLRNPDFFGGRLAVGGSKDFFFTPGDGQFPMPGPVKDALIYWSGLQIAFNCVLNMGNSASVFPFGKIHFIDPSGLKGVKIQDSYFQYLNGNFPGKISPEIYKKPGKGIPDIITTNPGGAQHLFYEIKPNNAAGRRDGIEKLGRIRETLDRFSLRQYVPGPQKNIEPLSLQVQNISVGAGQFNVFLEQTLDQPGLILYRFRFRFDVDPGPFITKAVIALAIVALIEGGTAVLGRAAGQAASGAVVNAAEEQGFQKVRVELLKRIAEEASSDVVREFAEQAQELTVESVLKKAVGK